MIRLVNYLIDFLVLFIGCGLLLSTNLNFEDLINSIATILLSVFFIILFLCSVICARYFDKILLTQKGITNKVGKIINITILPDNWLLNICLFKAMLYCGALFLKKIDYVPLMIHQRELIKNNIFDGTARRIDYFLSICLFICIVSLLFFLILIGILKIFKI